MQAMVVEPAAVKVHDALGAGPATRLGLNEISLRRLFADAFGGKP